MMCGSSCRVLITTWGNPYVWQETRYRVVEGLDSVSRGSGGGELFLSVTTLYPLYKRFAYDRVLLIVQDTLLRSPGVNTYSDVVREVESSIKSFIKERVNMDLYRDLVESDKIRVLVAPGVGSFKTPARLSVCGDPTDFYVYVLMRIAVDLVSVIRSVATDTPGERKSEIEIHLDTSHGINYMPVLTYRAVRELLPLTALGVERVKFKCFNSDPVQRVDETLHEININVIEERSIEKSDILSYTLEALKEENRGLRLLTLNERCVSREERDKIETEINRTNDRILKAVCETEERVLVKELSAFAGSIVNSLPLITFYTLPKCKLTELAEKVYESIGSFTKINSGRDSEIYISRKAKLSEKLAAVVKILFVAEILKISKGIDRRDPRKQGVSLEEIERLKDDVYRASNSSRAMLTNELLELKELLKSPKDLKKDLEKCDQVCDREGGWKRYTCIKSRDKCADRVEGRHFLAHAGLERCATCIKVVDNKILLKYDERYLEQLLEYSQERLARV